MTTTVKSQLLCACGKTAEAVTIERYPSPREEYDPSEIHTDASILADAIHIPKEEVWHLACFECSQNVAYYVPLDRMKNERQALGWTMHLMQKLWFRGSRGWMGTLDELFPGYLAV